MALFFGVGEAGVGESLKIREVMGDAVSEREEEFAALVERQSRLMFRVAYALLRNSHDAEDARDFA